MFPCSFPTGGDLHPKVFTFRTSGWTSRGRGEATWNTWDESRVGEGMCLDSSSFFLLLSVALFGKARAWGAVCHSLSAPRQYRRGPPPDQACLWGPHCEGKVALQWALQGTLEIKWKLQPGLRRSEAVLKIEVRISTLMETLSSERTEFELL